jgi:hypothetical protein
VSFKINNINFETSLTVLGLQLKIYKFLISYYPIENIKFNPNHKENNNVKITNTRSPTGLKYHNNKWMTVKKEELLNELFNLGIKMLNEWAKDKTEILTQSMIDNYEKYILFSKHFKKEDIKEELNLKAYIYSKNHLSDLDK